VKFQAGDVLGPYKILRVAGTGGMGEVYQVEHTLTRRVEALKVLVQREASEAASERFFREIRVQASLNHPNIAALHNALWIEDDLVMIMEWVEGESLSTVLDRGPLPLDTAISYGCQALNALAYAHAQGVLHRDVKPANMIITPAGDLKLTDFGLAKILGDDERRLTQSGAWYGTVHYMSPEQVRGITSLDARTDLYSLGAVMYEMVTGQKPFDSGSIFDIMSSHVEEPPRPPIELKSELSADLSRVILQAMAKRPEDRFVSAEAFHEALEGVRSGRGSGSLAAGMLSRKRLGTGLGVAAVIVTVFVGVQRWPRGEAPAAGSQPSAIPAAPSTDAQPAPAEPPGSQSSSSAPPVKALPPRPLQTVTVRAGTPLRVRTTSTISTQVHKAGETFTVTLEDALVADGTLVARAGAPAVLELVEIEQTGRIRRSSALSLRLARLQTSANRSISLNTKTISQERGGTRLPGLMRAPVVTIPSDTVLEFELQEAVRLTVPRTEPSSVR
jgi:serine/threonine protein kinase